MQENKERVKVCFAVTKGSPFGGAQKYVYTLATNLPTNAYDSSVIAGIGYTLQDKLREKGIRSYSIESMKRDISIIAEIKNFLWFFNIIRKERPDILHLNSPKASGLGAVSGRLIGVKKIIYTVHGFAFNENRSDLSKAVIWFFSWVTILLCHKIVVINEKERKQALAMPFVNDSKVVLIHNGIEKIDFRTQDIMREALYARIGKKQIGKEAGKVTCLGTIAELHKNKGLEYAITALSKIKSPFIYFIIGEGEERKNLEELIAKYNLQDKVFLIGFLDGAHAYLKAFDIFILPSIKEGLPYTIIEAGQAGLPVIASRVGGIPDIIDNSVSGILVTKGNISEIQKAVEYLIDNRDKQKLFGKNLKEKVEKEFSLEQMLEKTIKLYS